MAASEIGLLQNPRFLPSVLRGQPRTSLRSALTNMPPPAPHPGPIRSDRRHQRLQVPTAAIPYFCSTAWNAAIPTKR